MADFKLRPAGAAAAMLACRGRAASSAIRRRVSVSGGLASLLRGRCARFSSSSSSSSSGSGGSVSAKGAQHLPLPHDAPREPEPEPESPLVRDINKAMVEMPFSCIGYVMACRYAVFFPVVGLVKAFSLPVPTELALAYVLTRPLVKLRFPIELGVAALLSKAVPALTQVKVSALLGLLPPPSTHDTGPFYAVTDYLTAAYPQKAVLDPVSSVVQRLAKPADKYGAAFYCSRDLVGVSTMLALTVGLRSGLDVQSWLEGLGFGAALAGETAASLASGALVASLSSPLYLLSCGKAVPVFARWQTAVYKAVSEEVKPK